MIKKIPAQQVIKGMFICGNDRKWIETPFFRSKFLIKSDKQIKNIQDFCHFVFIDTEKGLDSPVIKIEESELKDNTPASKLYYNSLHEFQTVLEADQSLDFEKLKPISQNLLEGLNQYAEALLKLTL